MRKFLTTAALVGLLVSPAAAQEWTKEQLAAGLQKAEWTRFAPSGEEIQFEFLYAVKIDCSPQGKIIVKKARSPTHGAIQIEPSEGLINFNADSKYAKCNGQTVAGYTLKYKSDNDYTGEDSFKVLIIYANGMAKEVNYKIIVR